MTKARFNKSLHPRKPEGSLGRTAQDVHLDSHTAPELCSGYARSKCFYMLCCHVADLTGTELRLTNPKRDKEVVVQTFVDREQRFTKFTKSIKTTTTKTYLNLKINK